MLFSLVGGVFADRLDRERLLLYSQYIQMLCAFVLTVLFATHAVKVWHILTLSFVVGVGQSFGGPAYSALLPTLVEPQDLDNAISMACSSVLSDRPAVSQRRPASPQWMEFRRAMARAIGG